jgi:hypothetical protein
MFKQIGRLVRWLASSDSESYFEVGAMKRELYRL